VFGSLDAIGVLQDSSEGVLRAVGRQEAIPNALILPAALAPLGTLPAAHARTATMERTNHMESAHRCGTVWIHVSPSGEGP